MTDASGLPPWLVASLWGGLVSLGLLIGAFAGRYAPLKHRGVSLIAVLGFLAIMILLAGA